AGQPGGRADGRHPAAVDAPARLPDDRGRGVAADACGRVGGVIARRTDPVSGAPAAPRRSGGPASTTASRGGAAPAPAAATGGAPAGGGAAPAPAAATGNGAAPAPTSGLGVRGRRAEPRSRRLIGALPAV